MRERDEVKQDCPVVIIDGKCHLCHGLTRFLVEHDRSESIRFAALQSKAGRTHLEAAGMPPAYANSFIYYKNGAYYKESGAILRVLWQVGGAWRLLYPLLLVPPPLRNAAYRYVSRNRYRWFGGSEVCLLPLPHILARFVEDGLGNEEI
ncbi:DCC1-like thiol-disulfide oxidoreductase family protein [Paenibacillus sp. J5C_2022]|uniref:thiol-disulfide oxidoreductase DCC family protein n=1 Tax=Paenibacillus sp. J5C2022 TaxID=2977129 RepID=UPI0021CF55D6|nr:DCC1-like thiol-disulfide oxidoreductase family protein [Paenibacillus sp. J5C2022]MCU6708153.1 DCC1-like thiol-disulfide oxidoreductase family protein [Paenibacillus sp. J5C2022]